MANWPFLGRSRQFDASLVDVIPLDSVARKAIETFPRMKSSTRCETTVNISLECGCPERLSAQDLSGGCYAQVLGAEKSPARSAGVGTVAVFVTPGRFRILRSSRKEPVATDGTAQSRAVLMLL
jgi:hypothetical protein